MLVLQIGLQKIQKRLFSSFFDPQCLSNSSNNQVRIANGSQRDEADAFGKLIRQLSRHLQTQARFANAAGTREGHEAYLRASQEGTHCLYLLFASDQWGEPPRQVMGPNVQLVQYGFSFGWVFPGEFRGKHKERLTG